jgi:N-ethylmaleimide reductase
MSSLFTPVQMGRVVLENRLVMAPMTRSRADDDGVPSDLVATYYTQRAGAGLIISEGVYPGRREKATCVPGIETDEQVSAWKKSPTRCMLKAAEFSCN